MAKKEMSMTFKMDGKLASSFKDATKEAAGQLTKIEKKAKAVQAAQKRQDVTAIKNLGKSASSAAKSFSGLKNEVSGTVKLIGGLVAGNGILGASIYGIAKSSATAAAALGDNAQITGLGVDSFRELSHAADAAGLSEQEFMSSTLKLGETVKNALGGNQKAMDTFFRAGIDLRDSHGNIKTTEALYRELADTFATMEDGIGKSNLAKDLFGNAKVIPFLNGGTAGLDGMAAESRRFGPVISPEDIKNANAFNNSFGRIKAAVKGVSMTVGKELWPHLTELHEEVANGIADGRVWLEKELPGWIKGIKDDLPELKQNFKDAWTALKDGGRYVNDMVKGMGGWVPVLKAVVKYWLYWRTARIAYTLATTTREVYRLGASFVSAIPAMGRSAGRAKDFGVTVGKAVLKAGKGVRAGFSVMMVGARRWGGTLRLVGDAFKDFARVGIRSMAAATKSAVRFGVTLTGKVAVGVASFAKTAVATALSGMKVFAVAAGKATIAAIKFGIALLANPIGLAVAGIAALGGAIYLCVKHWDKITGAMGKAWDWIKGVFVAGWNMLPGWLQEPLVDAYNSVTGFVDDVLGVLGGVWDTVAGYFTQKGEKVSAAFDQGVLAGIVEAIKQFSPHRMVMDMLNGIVDTIEEFDIVTAGMNLIKSFGQGIMQAWDGIKGDIASAVTDWIPGGETLVKGAGKVAGAVGDVARWGKGKLSSIFGFAEGGVVRSPQIGLVGEAGPEVIVPVSRPRRGNEMLETAAGMLGRGVGQGGTSTYTVSFAPTFHLESGGGASVEQQIKQAYRQAKDDFLRTLNQVLADRAHQEQRTILR